MFVPLLHDPLNPLNPLNPLKIKRSICKFEQPETSRDRLRIKRIKRIERIEEITKFASTKAEQQSSVQRAS
jgi:hypothetical protein